jgi:hypothetical protein
MERRRRFSGAFFGVAALLAAAPANAEPYTAPLPPAYQSSGERFVDGLYADINGLNPIFDDQEIQEFESACQTHGKTVSWQHRDMRFSGAVRGDGLVGDVICVSLRHDLARASHKLLFLH